MIRFTLGCIAIFFTALWIVIGHSRAQVTFYPLDLPERFKIGAMYPPSAYCDWSTYASIGETYCDAAGDTSISFSIGYNGAVKSASRFIRDWHLTIGAMINQLGTPIGHRATGSGHYVYWSDRYAYIDDKHFSPSSIVGFIVYRAELSPPKWESFTNANLNLPGNGSGILRRTLCQWPILERYCQ